MRKNICVRKANRVTSLRGSVPARTHMTMRKNRERVKRQQVQSRDVAGSEALSRRSAAVSSKREDKDGEGEVNSLHYNQEFTDYQLISSTVSVYCTYSR